MDRRFDLIVFDWDGTLMDSTPYISECLQRACADLSIAPPSLEAANWIIGMDLAQGLRHAVPSLDAQDYPRLTAAYRQHFLAGDVRLPLFPGIGTLVAGLAAAGNLLAVATGKTRLGLERAFDHSGLRGHFHATRCADESFSKPNPAMLLDVMERTGAERHRTLMIGDTLHDLQLAANAGVASLAVSYGAHPRHALEGQGALAVLDSSLELADWLAQQGQWPGFSAASAQAPGAGQTAGSSPAAGSAPAVSEAGGAGHG